MTTAVVLDPQDDGDDRCCDAGIIFLIRIILIVFRWYYTQCFILVVIIYSVINFNVHGIETLLYNLALDKNNQ